MNIQTKKQKKKQNYFNCLNCLNCWKDNIPKNAKILNTNKDQAIGKS